MTIIDDAICVDGAPAENPLALSEMCERTRRRGSRTWIGVYAVIERESRL